MHFFAFSDETVTGPFDKPPSFMVGVILGGLGFLSLERH